MSLASRTASRAPLDFGILPSRHFSFSFPATGLVFFPPFVEAKGNIRGILPELFRLPRIDL
jgi:hypothetical protein